MPAEKQARRHHVQGLKVLVNPFEHLLEVGEYRAGELVDQKRARRMEY